MNLSDFLNLFSLFIVFLGLGLIIYTILFGLYLRLHLQLHPRLNKQFEHMRERLNIKDE